MFVAKMQDVRYWKPSCPHLNWCSLHFCPSLYKKSCGINSLLIYLFFGGVRDEISLNDFWAGQIVVVSCR